MMTEVSRHEIIQVGGVDVTPAMMETYKHTARTSAAQRRRRLAARQTHAMAVAQQAADMLRTDFGATQVVLIGSLTGAPRFMSAPMSIWSPGDCARRTIGGRSRKCSASILPSKWI